MNSRHSYIKIGLIACILFPVLFGLGLCIGSYIPFEWAKPRVDALSVDGDAERFTASVFANIVVRLRLVGIGLLLAGGLLAWKRVRLQGWTSKGLTILAAAFRTLWNDLRQSWQTALINEDRLHVYTLAFILLLGIGLRIGFLFQPMRHDEAFTYTNYASKPLVLALSNYSFPNNHLFHTFLVHLATACFGNHPWAIRFPAFLAGILLVPAVYLVIRTLYDKHAALLTAGLVASSSALVEYATNARGYALIGLFFFLLIGLGDYLKKTSNPAAWLLFVLLSSLGFYTVPVMLYPFGVVALWLMLSARGGGPKVSPITFLKPLLIATLSTVLLTSLFYLPVISGSGLDAITANRFVVSRTWPSFLHNLPLRLRETWTQWNMGYSDALSLLLATGVLAALCLPKRLAGRRFPLILAAALWTLAAIAIQRVAPPARVWLFFLPLYFGLAAVGLSLALRYIPTMRSTVVALATVVLTLWTGASAISPLTEYYPYGPGTLKDAEQITLYLKDHLQSGDRVLTIATAAPLEYYFLKHRVPIKYFRTKLETSSRVIVVVLENKYTLDEVMVTAQIPKKEYSTPAQLCRYKSARLYEMYKRQTAHLSEALSRSEFMQETQKSH